MWKKVHDARWGVSASLWQCQPQRLSTSFFLAQAFTKFLSMMTNMPLTLYFSETFPTLSCVDWCTWRQIILQKRRKTFQQALRNFQQEIQVEPFSFFSSFLFLFLSSLKVHFVSLQFVSLDIFHFSILLIKTTLHSLILQSWNATHTLSTFSKSTPPIL